MINAEKTIVMSFHTRQKRTPLKPQVTFDGMDIAYKSETKFLGILLSENMTWNVHIQSLSSNSVNFVVCMYAKGCNKHNCHKEYLF
jgi:hypothetical protein